MSRNSPGQRLRDKIALRKRARAERERALKRQTLQTFSKKRSVYDTLNQTKHWWDFENDAHTITSMSIRYKRNLLRWLERNAAAILASYIWGVPIPHLNGEMAQLHAEEDYEREIDRLMFSDLDPVEWIQSTPLYEAVQMSVARNEDGSDGEDPRKLERYRALQQEREAEAMDAAKAATWD